MPPIRMKVLPPDRLSSCTRSDPDCRILDLYVREDGRGYEARLGSFGLNAHRSGPVCCPKTIRRERLKENFGALDHRLTREQLAELDRLFPPPTGPVPLQMI
jgi:hypothetical protein